MIETDLTIQDFTKYFEKNKLGRFYFPNGEREKHYYLNEDGSEWEKNLSIELKNLYKIMSGWKINHLEVPLDEIIAIISYGSAVKYPGYKLIPETKKKFLNLFGSEIETGRKIRKDIMPNDIDFFVLTENDITRDEYIKPKTKDLTLGVMGSGGCITAIVEGGINLVNRGVEQLIKGVKNGDTISTSAFKEGIPIFYDKERLEEIRNKTGISKETPRKVYWDENQDGNLFGKIK